MIVNKMSTCLQLTAYLGAHPALIRSRQDGTGDNEGRRRTSAQEGRREGQDMVQTCERCLTMIGMENIIDTLKRCLMPPCPCRKHLQALSHFNNTLKT